MEDVGRSSIDTSHAVLSTGTRFLYVEENTGSYPRSLSVGLASPYYTGPTTQEQTFASDELQHSAGEAVQEFPDGQHMPRPSIQNHGHERVTLSSPKDNQHHRKRKARSRSRSPGMQIAQTPGEDSQSIDASTPIEIRNRKTTRSRGRKKAKASRESHTGGQARTFLY